MRNVTMTIWVMVMSVCLCAMPAFGWTQFNDGGTHDITATINDDVWVDYESPGMETTVNLLPGGAVDSIQGHEDSVINLVGGLIDSSLYAYDSSHVNIFSGSTNTLLTYDESQANMSGGVSYWAKAEDNSQIYFSGGSISSYFMVYNNSRLVLSGGLIGDELAVADSGVIIIFGSDFAVDGNPVGYAELTSILGGECYDEPSRLLTGTLLNGDLVDNRFYIGNDSSIVLAVPGDFDGDNDVDGVDFGFWQAGYPMASGATPSNGDADQDGDVDGVDFGIW